MKIIKILFGFILPLVFFIKVGTTVTVNVDQQHNESAESITYCGMVTDTTFSVSQPGKPNMYYSIYQDAIEFTRVHGIVVGVSPDALVLDIRDSY